MEDVDLPAALRAAKDGDEQGFAVLWRELNPPVVRYLRVVVSEAAEDVASETWLQVARDLRRYRGDAQGFRVWVFRIARNRAIDELRRAGRRAEEPLDDSVDQESGDDTARDALDRLATERALELISSLPPDQAEAVMLRVVAGLDVAQTAKVLGKRPGAVRVATMRGLRGLARRLEQDTSRCTSGGGVTR
ncbi:MAG: RNA polymerase sigma factor [Mycobacteriales bacterium]